MKRKWRVAVTADTVAFKQVSGSAGADAVREQHPMGAALGQRGARAEHGDQ
jgi:hypothetical protein